MQKKVNSPVKDEVRQGRQSLKFKVKKTLDSSLSTLTTPSPDTLLPTSEIIDIAKKSGVDFGPGNPNERIRYFIKLGILPHTVRKSTGQSKNKSSVDSPLSTLTNYSITGLHAKAQAPAGHLPFWTIARLTQIDSLKKAVFCYPKIAKKIKSQKKQSGIYKNQSVEQDDKPSILKPIEKQTPSINFFPKFGVSEKNIAEKLKNHERNLSRIIDKKLGNLQHQNLFESNLVELN